MQRGEHVDVALSDLLVDEGNPRFEKPVKSQRAALQAMAKLQQHRLVNLAKHIVENGLDPTTIPVVLPTDDDRKRYRVLEGNRRVTALKGLETPALVVGELNAKQTKRFNALAARYQDEPVETLRCVMFESESDALPWIELRHTGAHDGVGVAPWGSDEKDRFVSRHRRRSAEGQVLDFLRDIDALSEEAQASKKGVNTSLGRLLSTAEVRAKLGVEKRSGTVYSHFPPSEVAKGLARVVEDLKTEAIKVADIYDKGRRIAYIKGLPDDDLPDESTRLKSPVELGEEGPAGQTSEDNGEAKKQAQAAKKRRRRARRAVRTVLIPGSCRLQIDPPRINKIYGELCDLSADNFPNACAVLLRVFLELSVDHFIEEKEVEVPQPKGGQNPNLGKRMVAVAKHLQEAGAIEKRLVIAVEKLAKDKFVSASATFTLNQFVHNKYVIPGPTELKDGWDQVQPFMEAIWP